MTITYTLTARAEEIYKKDIWGQHPDFPRSEWQDEAFDSLTQLGYWEWVQHKVEGGA